MITLFEKFNNKFKLSNYIYQDKWELESGETGITFTIPNVFFERFDEYFIDDKHLNTDYFIPIQYNSLMRLFIYVKLLRYNGDNPETLEYVNGLKNKDKDAIEIIGKIPNNNGVFNFINKKFNFGFPDYEYDNVTELKKLILNIDEVLSDKNLEEYIKSVKVVSDKAKVSEKIVKGVIAMMYGRYYDILHAKTSDDKKGVDVWMINKDTGVKQAIQVKNITGNVTFNVVDDKIYINNTNLDLHEFATWDKTKLPFDYLGFYLEYEKKVCIIKSNAIFTIEKPQKRNILIKLKNWALEPRFSNVFKMVNIPPKLLPKDYSKIFITKPDVKTPAQIKKKTS